MAQVSNETEAMVWKRPSFCGKGVTDEEWNILHEVIDSCGLSRHELASTICESLGWVRANGNLKSQECYEYLDLLEAGGLVELPRRREQRRRGPTSIHYTKAGRKGSRREGNLSDVAPVTLGLVAHAEERALWRELVERYHYLGHKVAYGAHLRYLVWSSKSRRELSGCVQFSSSARRLRSRDGFIGWDDATRQKNLRRVVNNSRFLILPWFSIKGLASHVLSLAARVVVDDWEEAYGVRPVLLETFVERERNKGTSRGSLPGSARDSSPRSTMPLSSRREHADDGTSRETERSGKGKEREMVMAVMGPRTTQAPNGRR